MPYYEMRRAYPAEPVTFVFVHQSSIDDPDPWSVTLDVGDFVAHMVQSCRYRVEDLPHLGFVSAWTNYYVGEVQNGGHAQFIGNSEADPDVRAYVREGLRILDLREHIAIFAELEAYALAEPESFAECDWNDTVLQALDDKFFALPIERFAKRHHDWLVSSDWVRALPDSQYHTVMGELKTLRQEFEG